MRPSGRTKMVRRSTYVHRLERLGFTFYYAHYWSKEYPDRTLYVWLGESAGFCVESAWRSGDLPFNNLIELEEAIIYESLRLD